VPPDCPVHQWSNGYFVQWSPAKAEFQMNSARTVRIRAAQPSEAHRTVNSTCPVQHRTVRCHKKSKLQRSNPNGWLMWLAHRTVFGGAPDSVRWRTGLSGAPINSILPQQLNWWLKAINTPQPPPLQPSKHSQQCIEYKSNTLYSKDTIQVINPLQVSNSTLAH
jgi:hypothetical protein